MLTHTAPIGDRQSAAEQPVIGLYDERGHEQAHRESAWRSMGGERLFARHITLVWPTWARKVLSPPAAARIFSIADVLLAAEAVERRVDRSAVLGPAPASRRQIPPPPCDGHAQFEDIATVLTLLTEA
jgi:hypothetical protein